MDQKKIAIAWDNLQYETVEYLPLKQFGSKKIILKQLNGCFELNSLNGLMGPSGAGKTTLLNCLSGTDISGLTANSAIYVPSAGEHPLVSYFIEQHAHQTIIGQLTVEQILKYAFKFKNGTGQSANKMMKQHIARTIKELLLDTAILNQTFEKCSGGQQKRIAIGQELMALVKPDFLFIDEPTTGLDSFSALEVIKCLSLLATTNCMTIITSIHAPSDEILHCFDKLYVLAKGGVCIYSGPANLVQSYLEKKLQISISQIYQPIETLISIACDGHYSAQVQALASSIQTTELLPHLQHLSTGFLRTFKPFTFSDLTLHISRQFHLIFIAQSRLFFAELLFHVLTLLLFVSFFDSRMTIPNGCSAKSNRTVCNAPNFTKTTLLLENITYLSFLRIFQGFTTLLANAVVFSSAIKVFRSEHRNKWYSTSTFYFSTILITTFKAILFSMIFVPLSYFLISEHTIDSYPINWIRLLYFYCITLLNLFYSQALGQALGVLIIESTELAMVLASIGYSTMTILDDFFFITDKLQSSLHIEISNAGGLKYITKLLVYIFYGFNRCDMQSEYSWVLEMFYVDSKQIFYYTARIVGNILLIRMLTYLILLAKFNWILDIKIPYFQVQKKTDLISCKLTINNNPNETEITINQNELKDSSTNIEKSQILIAFRNLTLNSSNSLFATKSTYLKRPILNNLNGQFNTSTLNAVMGMSGAGKTSLLRILNGQLQAQLSPESKIYLNKFTSIQMAFITQKVSGHLFDGLTSKQLLIYASRLKNQPVDGHQVDHKQIALNLLNELGLSDTVNTKVENCSGGERKRLALALELTSIQMPNLVCIDEPTSGLDSNSAEIVISTLRTLTQKHNITIIASIHQPNTKILMLFDQLYTLAIGGVCIYSGPSTAIGFHLSQIDTFTSKYPIETLIKLSCSGSQDQTVQKLSDLVNRQFSKLELKHLTQPIVGGILQNRIRFSSYATFILFLRYLAYIRGYLWKECIAYLTFYLLYGYMLQLFFNPAIGLPSGCLNLEDDFISCSENKVSEIEMKQIIENLKYMVLVSTIIALLTFMQSCVFLLKEMPLFINEHRNGWYSTGSFYTMKVLTDALPILVFISAYVYIVNIYESVRPGLYFPFFFILLLAIFICQSIGHIILLISNFNFIIFIILSLSYHLVNFLLCNTFIRYSDLHYVYQMLSNFTYAKFTMEALVLLLYGFGRCADKQIQPVLYLMELKDEDYGQIIFMLVFNLILYRIIAIYLLVRKVNCIEKKQ